MSSGQGRAGSGIEQRKQQRFAAQRREAKEKRIRRLVLLGGGALVVVAIVGWIGYGLYQDNQADQEAEELLTGEVESFEDLPATHVQGAVEYDQTPPVGGPHSATWQNCGFYAAPVNSENAVHSMEHGAVWITYQPDLPADQVGQLRELAEGTTYILVSQHANLPAPVVASAWGKQVQLQSASDPALDAFVRTYRQGPQTLEPGAACTGGTSATR
jgi:hypothetical protein